MLFQRVKELIVEEETFSFITINRMLLSFPRVAVTHGMRNEFLTEQEKRKTGEGPKTCDSL